MRIQLYIQRDKKKKDILTIYYRNSYRGKSKPIFSFSFKVCWCY